ncbi:MAG: aminopeptidase [Desulfobacterales bacterium]
MLNDKQLDRYADVLLWGLKTARKGKAGKNEIVVIRYDLPAIPLVEVLHKKLIQMGVHPVQRLMQTPRMEKNFYTLARKQQLMFIPPGESELYQHLNGAIAVLGPESLTHLGGIDPNKIAQSLKARKSLREILDQREESGLFSWTLGMYPTAELAEHAGMPVTEYADQIIKACF